MSAKPLSAQELCETVRQQIPFDAARLDRVLRVDKARALVEVQAGATWRRLAEHLRPGDERARGLRTTKPTIGESIAWNAAGPDGRPTVSHLESFTLATPEGQLKRVDRVLQPQLFSLVVGGQGLFGPMYSATLRLDSLERALADARAPESVGALSAGRPLVLLVPPEQLETLVREAGERCAQWRVGLQSMQLRLIRQEDETYLCWARREYAEVTLGIGEAATLGGNVRMTQLRRELIDVAIACGGGFPIACTPEATRAQTQHCYPQLAEFLAEQRRIDPQGRWENAWLRHYRSLLAREPCAGRWAQAEP